MLWPEDWDKPSEDNRELCSLFSSGIWHDKEDRTLYLKYRFYDPKTKEKCPLSVYLHGADAFGDDNLSQLSLHDIGTMFAKKEWQDSHPCYILAPQCDQKKHWSRKEITKALQELVSSFIADHDNIDTDRIYIYGYSAGGIGTLSVIKENPGFYAAAVPICGASGGDNIGALVKTPVWLVHAFDDRIVKASYGNPGEGSKFYLGSRDIYELLSKRPSKCEILYTEYPAGWMKDIMGVNPHCSWVAVSDARQGSRIREWMFRQKRKAE